MSYWNHFQSTHIIVRTLRLIETFEFWLWRLRRVCENIFVILFILLIIMHCEVFKILAFWPKAARKICPMKSNSVLFRYSENLQIHLKKFRVVALERECVKTSVCDLYILSKPLHFHSPKRFAFEPNTSRKNVSYKK